MMVWGRPFCLETATVLGNSGETLEISRAYAAMLWDFAPLQVHHLPCGAGLQGMHRWDVADAWQVLQIVSASAS